jgi:nucleotide-binding universal stress UspA family protein
MKPFTPCRILAATDFSDLSTWALRHAVVWARHFGSELTVLHVQELVQVIDKRHMADCAGQLLEACREAAEEQLAQTVLLQLPADVPARREIRSGAPASVIEECATSEGMDLVVLGTHGRRGLNRLLLGSVAEQSLRVAQRPTLIVHPPQDQSSPASEAPGVRHILCPVNYSAIGRIAFEHAASVAQQFGARLTVLFAVEEEDGTAESLRRAEARLRSWLPADTPSAYDLQPVIRVGDAAQEIILLARETAADLIVIGAQHRRFVDTTVLGVTTERVTRHATCPVLVAPRQSNT